MKKIRNFIKTSVLGGVGVILPAAILFAVFKWIFGLTTEILRPLTHLLMVKSQIQELVADIMVICVILAICFLVGVFVKTRIGLFIQENLENRILKIFPGYTMIKEIVMQLFNKNKSPFSSVALVRLLGNDVLVTGFITDTHPNGTYTVFVPAGPNPTTGGIFHLKAECVHLVDVPVEKAMRSVISCGAGSDFLIEAYSRNHSESKTLSSPPEQEQS
jgi:uncharacterized membrane protein